jgi:hypothetical protein
MAKHHRKGLIAKPPRDHFTLLGAFLFCYRHPKRADTMPEERVKRKLSAILSADVKGYRRLMGEDGLASARTLETHREHQKRKEDEHGSQNHY